MRKNELLVPASSLEVLKIAVIYGADAVYIGGEAFGLRAKAKNFTMEEMAEGIAFAHARGVKVYVTANILAHNYDLDGVREYLTELQNMKPDRPDALIIADPAIFTIAGEVCPPYQYTGKQHQLRNISVLGETRCYPCGNGKRTFPAGDPADPGTHFR